MTLPVPPHVAHGPSLTLPRPEQPGQIASPVPGVPGRATSPGLRMDSWSGCSSSPWPFADLRSDGPLRLALGRGPASPIASASRARTLFHGEQRAIAQTHFAAKPREPSGSSILSRRRPERSSSGTRTPPCRLPPAAALTSQAVRDPESMAPAGLARAPLSPHHRPSGAPPIGAAGSYENENKEHGRSGIAEYRRAPRDRSKTLGFPRKPSLPQIRGSLSGAQPRRSAGLDVTIS